MHLKEQPRGRVFDIQRASLQDGPGIRTTVFLKGCPLRCPWCHNPEGLSVDAQLLFNDHVCVGCGCCAAVCPNGVHHFSGKDHILEFDKCTPCGICIEHCSHSGLRAVGTEMSVDDVLLEVRADIVFYENSGGGIKLSGGEPLGQLAFAMALLEKSKESGIHTCIETSGFAASSEFQKVFPLVDLLLLDYKLTDCELHKKYTGVSNELILQNLDSAYNAGVPIILRCPIIPDVNDSLSHFEGIRQIEEQYPGLRGIELMPYHNLGTAKGKGVGRAGQTAGFQVAGQSIKDEWMRQLSELGCRKVKLA